MGNLIGVDIGGTKCAIVLGSHISKAENKGSEGLDIQDRMAFPTGNQIGVQNTIDRILQNIRDILVKNGVKTGDLEGIGISCGGPLDSNKGIIMSPPNLIGWDNIKIVELLEREFGIKTRLQNDANACALAEWKYGAARGYRNVIFLTFGTGMGAGLILDGRLYNGTNDMAGEVGHIRLDNIGPVGYGKMGSFEGFCSGGGIAQLARMKVLERHQTGKEVIFCKGVEELDGLNAKIVGDAAEAGDELAKEIYAICGQYLGKGLSLLIDILNPEIIVIGSIFARSRELLMESVMDVVKKDALSHSLNVCRIVPTGLGEKIGDYASLEVAIYEK